MQTAVCGLWFPMKNMMLKVSNCCAKFWGVNKVHYGLYENGAFTTQLLSYKLSAQRLRDCLGGQALVVMG